MRIAVTGGIASGKSSLVYVLRDLLAGHQFTDFDSHVRAMYQDVDFRRALVHKFGTAERSEVSNIVFKDPEKMAYLCRLTDTSLGRKLEDILSAPNCIVEVPMLFEHPHWLRRFDYVITVACSQAEQRERLIKRDNISEEKASQILGSQFSPAIKTALADLVIDTSLPLTKPIKDQMKPLFDRLELHRLHARAQQSLPPETWMVIGTSFNEEHRHYHGFSHLTALFHQYDKVKHLLNFPEAVAHAIWFHDVVYDVENTVHGQNERDSVRVYYEVMRTQLDTSWGDEHEGGMMYSRMGLVSEFIMCTIEHNVTSLFLLNHKKAYDDALVFLDLDLSILGTDEATFDAYDDAIRQEYAHVNDVLFARGRVHALQSLACKPRIFQSPHFADMEEQARKNLERAVRKWELRQ